MFLAGLGTALFWAVAAGPATQSIAILPSVGKAPEDARLSADNALRAALRDTENVDLLSPVDTHKQVMGLAEMGMVCLPEDENCLVKLGVTAGVSFVLVPEVDPTKGKELEIQVGVIDVDAGRRVRTVKDCVAVDDAGALDALVREALDLPAKDGAVKHTLDLNPDGGGDGHHVVDPIDDHGDDHGKPEEPAKPFPIGGIVAGIGGSVAVLAAVGAVTCELVYSNILHVADKEARENVVQPTGAALWLTTALAATAGAAGLYLVLSAPAEAPPSDGPSSPGGR